MANRVAVIGMGQTHHRSRRDDVNGYEMINEAVTRALEDAEMSIDDIDAVIIGNMDHFESVNYVDCWSINGSGGYLKPVIKVTTGGTTGTSLAISAFHHVASGIFDTVLVIGWEKNSESDTTGAIITCSDPFWDRFSYAGAIPSLATEALAYMKKYDISEKDAARVTVRDRRHAVSNPYAHLRKEVTVEDVLESPMISYPIKLLDVCPRTDGACALIYASENKAKKLSPRPAWIWTTAVRHMFSYFGDINYIRITSLEEAAREVYDKAGIKEPLKELDVVELYQPYSFGGLKWIEALGLCSAGKAPELVWDGVTDMGGELPFNPSGGVIATNCIGATGLLRTGEAALQVMGRSTNQVPDVDIAMATGFGGAYWSDILIMGSSPR